MLSHLSESILSRKLPPTFGGWRDSDFMSATPLKALSALIAECGANAVRLFRQFGLDIRSADREGQHISTTAYLHLLEHCAVRFGRPFFGIELAERQTLDTFGPITTLVRSSPTLRSALLDLSHYLGVHAPAMSYSVIDRDDGTTDLCAINRLETVSHCRQGIEMGLSLMSRLIVSIIPAIKFEAVRIVANAPQVDLRPIRQHFSCTILYDEPVNAIVFPTTTLAILLPSRDDFVAGLVRDHLDRLLRTSDRRHSAQVSALIKALLPSGRCTIETCAWQLGLAPRTLQSRLAALDTDFSTILANERRSLAEFQLEHNTISVSGIAAMLGYSDQATFSRAFRSWTGEPPSSYRRRARTGAPGSKAGT